MALPVGRYLRAETLRSNKLHEVLWGHLRVVWDHYRKGGSISRSLLVFLAL